MDGIFWSTTFQVTCSVVAYGPSVVVDDSGPYLSLQLVINSIPKKSFIQFVNYTNLQFLQCLHEDLQLHGELTHLKTWILIKLAS